MLYHQNDHKGASAAWNKDLSINDSSYVVRIGTFQDAKSDIHVAKRSSVLGHNLDAKLNSPEYFGDSSPKIGFRCAADN